MFISYNNDIVNMANVDFIAGKEDKIIFYNGENKLMIVRGLKEKEVSSLMKLLQYAIYKDMKVLDLNYQINKLREKWNENDVQED